MVFNINTIRLFVIFIFIAINQVYAQTIINTTSGRIGGVVEWTKKGSPYILQADVQIERDRGFLKILEGVEIQGNGKKIMVGNRLLISGTEQSKVIINNVNIEPGDFAEKISLNIEYLNMKQGSIYFSSQQRRADGFSLKYSTLDQVSVRGQYAMNSVSVIGNTFKSTSRWSGSSFNCERCNNGVPDDARGILVVEDNNFEQYGQLYLYNPWFKSISVRNNNFKEKSSGLNIYHQWSDTRADINIVNNNFNKTNGGLTITRSEAAKYTINDNVFKDSPGISYSNYEGRNSFEVKRNFFLRQKNYAVQNTRGIFKSKKIVVQDNMFCSVNRIALKLNALYSGESHIPEKINYFNTSDPTTMKDYMLWDGYDDLNIQHDIGSGIKDKTILNPNNLTNGRKQADWLTTSQVLACNKEREATETKKESCTLGGAVYEDGIVPRDGESCSFYKMVSDIQIPKNITLRILPGVDIRGFGKRIRVEGSLIVGNEQTSKLGTSTPVKLDSVNIQPVGFANQKIQLYGLNMKQGSIYFSSQQRRADGFSLKYSTLDQVSVRGQYAMNSVSVIGNTFKSTSRWSGSSFNCERCNNGVPDDARGILVVEDNNFEQYGQLYLYNPWFKSISVRNNNFKEKSSGLNIYHQWSDTRADINIVNNNFNKTNGGLTITRSEAAKYTINDNVFKDSPGISYSNYEGRNSFEVNSNTFCKQKNYAIYNSRNSKENNEKIKNNNFCSVDRVAVKLASNRDSNMNVTGNYWNGASPSTIQRKMIWDYLDNINVYNHVSWRPALSTPIGESLGGYSDKFGGTVLQSCLPDSSTNAGSICAVICEGLEIEGDAPEPVVDPGAEIPLTFPPAVIIPRSTPKGSDAILQSIFNIRVGHQWEGHLKKYKLKKDGAIGDLQWDAGKLLNDNKQASSRNIFTVGEGLTVFGKNNFKESNIEKLKPILYGDSHANVDIEDAKKLINFVRGVDVFDEDKDESSIDERWKLGDTYHADLLVVGPPNARVTDNPDKANTDASYRHARGYHKFALGNKNRRSVIFAAANDGMLHAFDLENGEELWAFIPPMVLPRLQLMQSATTNQSTSIYGVDGSPVYKDVYINGRWKTVVMGGLGMGGHGYYALDVTDIENPVHMFSFSYDPATRQGSIWQGKNGQKTLTNDFNKLGEAWSKPLMLRVPTYGWIAVFGGGFNNEISEYGSMVYIVDLENQGGLIKAINVHDNSNRLTNTVPASMTAITPDSSDKANYTGAMVYFADLEGKLWKLDLTDQGSMFNMEQVFDAEASHANQIPPGNGRLAYFPVAPSIGNDGKLRLFYGTGDMQDLMDNNQNVDNRFYGIKDQNFSNPARQGTDNKFTESSLKDTTNNADICTDEDDKGWKIKLKPTEKVTSKANVSYGTVTFSRYAPLITENCELGKTSITGVDYQCGSEKFTVDLGTGITTVPTLYRGKLYIGISGDAINTFTTPEGWIKKDNLLMGKPGDLSTWQGVKTKSWREGF